MNELLGGAPVALGLAKALARNPRILIDGAPSIRSLNCDQKVRARDRVRAALVNSGREWPNRRITVNLLPAALPKHGSGFDLAIAAALLAVRRR